MSSKIWLSHRQQQESKGEQMEKSGGDVSEFFFGGVVRRNIVGRSAENQESYGFQRAGSWSAV